MALHGSSPEGPNEDMSGWSPRRKVDAAIGAIVFTDYMSGYLIDYLGDPEKMPGLLACIAAWAEVPVDTVERYVAKGDVARHVKRAQDFVRQLGSPENEK